jgi:hypothetical protein
VIGTVREEAGWERVYRLRPAANPGSAAHVLVLVATAQGRDLASAFPSDSLLEGLRLDSIARLQRADSVVQAAKAARAARRDSLQRADSVHATRAARAARRDSLQRGSPIQGGTSSGVAPLPEDSVQ